MVVGPLDANRFAVYVALEFLKQSLSLPCVLDCLEVVSHLVEELLLIDPAVQLSKSLVTLVVRGPVKV